MADLIEKMTRASDTVQSWHNKENVIPHDAPFDAWFDASGINFKVLRSKVRYATDRNADSTLTYMEMPSRHVLFRSDTHAPLSVVSEGYKVVQPRQILEFYRAFCESNQLSMDTAGVLDEGRRVWALARTNAEVSVGGNPYKKDIIKQYILLATSYDTSMATIAKHTAVRVVCNNTLTLAANNSEASIRIPHSAEFDSKQVQLDLGLLQDDFVEFGYAANEMHRIQYEPTTAARWYAELLKGGEVTDPELVEMLDNRVLRGLMKSYAHAPGNEPTLWGVVNGTTAFVDHVRGRGYDTRMNSAWFGQGDLLKRKAWEKAIAVIDAAKAASADVVMA